MTAFTLLPVREPPPMRPSPLVFLPHCPFSGNDSDDFIAAFPPSLLPASWACETADRSAKYDNGGYDDDDASFVTEISDSTPNARHPYKLSRAPWPRFACKKRNLTGGHNLEYVSFIRDKPSLGQHQIRGASRCTCHASELLRLTTVQFNVDA